MDDGAIEMTPLIGPDGEPIYCAIDAGPSLAQLTAPRSPILGLIVIAASGVVLLALTAKLK